MAELQAERGDWREHKECLKKALQLNPALPVTEISSKIVQKATLKGHAQQVFPLQINPTQDILASSGSDGSIRLWDIKTGRSLKVLNKAGFTTSLDFSPTAGNSCPAAATKRSSSGVLSKAACSNSSKATPTSSRPWRSPGTAKLSFPVRWTVLPGFGAEKTAGAFRNTRNTGIGSCPSRSRKRVLWH